MVIMLASPLEVLLGKLDKVLGTPKDIKYAGECDTTKPTEVPLPVSVQKVVV
jgi:hypothetical protein